MELSNEFKVSVEPETAWKVLTDVERIAPLLPGAQLQEVEGDEYRGVVKVKVGPIQAQYKGTATFVEQDESGRKVVLKATGRDTRGQGNANATITAVMTPEGGGTKVSVVTDLTVTGKVASFGRGVLADVSSKLIGQFVTALEADLEKGGAGNGAATPAAPAAPEGVPAKEEAGQAAAGEPLVTEQPEAGAGAAADSKPTAGLEEVVAGGPVGPGTTAATPAPPQAAPASTGPRRIEAPEPEPVDLLEAAGGSVAKRVVPLAGGLALIVIVLVLRRRARARRSEKARLQALLSRVDPHALAELRAHAPDPRELSRRGRKAAAKAAAAAEKAGARAAAKAAKKAGQVRHARG